MSLRKNIIASSVGQVYGAAIGIVMVPVLVRYLGAEAYGLVGFFAMLQACFQLLDLGLTPTIARETARFTGGARDAFSLRCLLRALEGIFLCLALSGIVLMLLASSYISYNWLNVQKLPVHEVQHAVMLMAAIVALRWMSGLYRGAISGFERLAWLSGFNSAVDTARFVLVIPILSMIGATPKNFFSYQLVVALVEIIVLTSKVYRLLPQVSYGQRIRWKWEPLRDVIRFSLNIAFTTAIWVIVTQADKLLLSNLLPLTTYGYFTLAVLAASGVMLIGSPISNAFIPRLVSINAKGEEAELVRLYRLATQLVAVVTISAALVLAFFPEQVLWVWTGDAEIVRNAAPVLSLYAAGYAILPVAAFPAHLQVAKGDLSLHVIGSVLFVSVLIPTLILSTNKYGVVGAGYAWLSAHVLYFICWVPLVHRRFFKGLHVKWLVSDVGVIALTVFACCLAIRSVVAWPTGRVGTALLLAIVSAFVLGLASISSSLIREYVLKKLTALSSRVVLTGK